MNIKKIEQKKHTYQMRSLFMNLFIFIMAQVLFQPFFETCDDNYMAAITYGTYGEYCSYFVFSNLVLGKIIKSFMIITPFFPWYTILQYLGLFVSMTVVTYLILKNERNQYRVVISWIILIIFGYECYVKLQFTKTAGLMAIAGILLIYEAIKVEHIKKRYLILGIMLSVFSSFWRFSSFCMVLPIVGSIALFSGFRCIKGKEYKIFGKYVVIYATLFVVCFGLNSYSDNKYQQIPEWSKYLEFNKSRGALLDYGFPDYDENRSVYQQLGISENDLELYRNWNFGDPELFTKENLEKLASVKEERTLGIDTLRGFLQQFPVRYLEYPYFSVLIILLVLWIISTKKNKYEVYFSLMAAILVEFYLFYGGRYYINRLDMPICFALCAVLALQIEKVRYDGLNKYVIAAVAGGIILNGGSFLNEAALPKTDREKEEAQEVFDLINEDKEHFYVMENYTSDDLWTTAYSVWDIPPKGLNSNCYVMGGWRYNTPLTNEVKDSYGVKNPYRDVVNNSNAYIINDFSMQSMLRYIQEHYYPTAEANLVKEINGHRIYQITTKEIKPDVDKSVEFGDDIDYQFSITEDLSGTKTLEGYVYKENTNSYHQKVYVGKSASSDEQEQYFVARSTEKAWFEERTGKYSWFRIPLADMKLYNTNDIKKAEITVYLEVDGALYEKKADMEELLEKNIVRSNE